METVAPRKPTPVIPPSLTGVLVLALRLLSKRRSVMAIDIVSFSDWARAQGSSDVLPLNGRKMPMTSLVANLMKRGGTQEHVARLLTLWDRWREELPVRQTA
jgi:hypothetical protein